MKKTKIIFEDKGQDCLYWIIDEKGKVVDCSPTTRGLWLNSKVILGQLKIGIKLSFTNQGDILRFKYLVEKIEAYESN
ncbi:hypothetical protein [Flavobacterium sp. HSC-61S13]|uniref:hypothetical protein n=1 Tax=Flavobacterium sp. HSC-61S13 TaxID=2910963 RepID=UPI0020A0CA10|nr:hypothetical protein [Flavobacterium sp. HSC-61S13]MCP1997278.1 hypothetical protein [Flavobacterium sp. HSC-61S13]